MRYRAFRTKKNNLYYFQFLTNDGTAVLKSGSFADKAECFEGIRDVMQSAGDAGKYSIGTNDDGKFVFTLQGGNGETAGTSVEYDNREAAEQAAALMQAEGPTANSNTAGGDSGEGAAKQQSKPASTSTRSDDYKPLAFYESHISGQENGFDTFADEGESYFTYNIDGLVLLISEGYSSENGRDNGINSVTKNMPNPDRYQRKVHNNGKHYFNLRAGNNQEIATSRWFDDEGSMNQAIGMLTSGGQGDGSLRAMFFAGSGNIYKDYKPLSFYEAHIAGEGFGFDSFADDNKSYFTVNYDGAPVLISEDYNSTDGRDNGIKSVKKNVKNEKRYVREVHPNGKHYFRLLAGNKQEIATSRWYDSEKEMEKAIAWLLSTGGTRRRKKPQREKKPAAERIYVKQKQSYPCSEITYDTFQSGGNGKYYFVFKTKEDKAILINGDVRGHENTESLDAAIAGVMKYAPDEKNYTFKETKNGKHYFYVQNEDGKNVARSSLFYADKDVMNAAIKLLACGIVGIAKAAPAAAVAATNEAVIDDYLVCQAYSAEDGGFHSFQNEDNQEYYFSYNRPSGKTLLRSEGYTTVAARDNGIQSVTKNAPLEGRWGTDTVLNGKYYYYFLKAGNHQEIARSCYYDSEAEMMADFNWVKGEDSTIGMGSGMVGASLMSASMMRRQKEEEAAKAVPAPTTKEAIVDDYLSCNAYLAEAGGFHSFQNEENKEYYFSYNSPGGTTLLRSEGYTTAAARDNGIQSVIKNSPIEERWGTDSAMNGKYHFYFLKAGNHQEIARSCYYDSEAAMLSDFKWVKGEDSTIGMGSGMVGASLMSASMIRRQKEDETAKAAEIARLAAEAEAKAKAEAEAAAKAKAEEEARLAAAAKAEEEARLAAEAKAKAEAEAAAKAKAEKAAAAAATAAAAALAAKQKAEKERRTALRLDDYLPCKEYAGEARGGFHTFEKDGEYYFSYIDNNGTVQLRSEGYKSIKARDNGIESVMKNAPIDERWSQESVLNGKYHFYKLKAGNNQEIARSCYSEDAAAMKAGWGWWAAAFAAPLAAAKAKEKADAEAAAAAAAAAATAAALAAKQKAEAEARIAAEEKRKADAAKAAAAAAAAAATAKAANIKAERTEIIEETTDRGGLGWLWWLLPLLLLALLAFFLMRGCDSCNKVTPPPTPIVPVDTIETVIEEPKEPFGADGAALGFGAGTMEYNMANFLSDANRSFPRNFEADRINFSKNSARLNTEARKQLDNVVALLKEYPDITVDIYGYIDGTESGTYRGSKEISLDDVRARAVYDYLKKRGIDESRMNFQGAGTNTRRSVDFRLNER